MISQTRTVASINIQVRDIFSRVTRYPQKILLDDAKLEEDLGIDSIKLGEIFAVLREEFHLPEDITIPPESLTSINSISQALFEYLDEPELNPAVNHVASSGLETVTPLHNGPVEGLDNLEEQIRQVFAEVTRYPLELLTPQANLEEDLGIDSVKLAEIFSVLREKYHLPDQLDITPEQTASIASISSALKGYLQNGHDTSSPEIQLHHQPETSQPAKPFEGKIAFVSGSGRGLGKAIAAHLAEQGATVIINSFHSREKGIKTEAEIKAKGGKVHHIWGSMANPEQLDTIFDEIEANYEGLDFFISNASNGMLARLEDITVQHWEKAYKTNVVGLHQASLRAVQLMKKRGGGKIITMSSPAAHGFVDYFGCMGPVKAAVESLTKYMAIEFSKYNIQVNCVSPGPVYGELLNKWPERERLIPQWENNTAYSRLCEAEDVAQFIAYLLKDEVQLFAGSVLVMDGGISSKGW